MNIQTGKAIGRRKPSIESGMHRKIYQLCPNILSIVHTHSPFTVAVSLCSEFRHVIEEAELVVGSPSVISNKPSGSGELALAVANEFRDGAKAVVVKNHGVVAGAPNIQQARAIVESLEEWSKILAISNMFGRAREFQ
jgi:L-fuculose-phosphate aldolase